MHKIENAHFEDMKALADIMVGSFRSAFAGFVSRETLDACTVRENCRALLENVYRQEGMHFLKGDGCGMLVWQETAAGAEIVAIHSLPESWGTGLGAAMLREALSQIRESGKREVFLWAFQENARARRFYEKQGFYWDGSRRVSEFDGAIEVRYCRKM